MASYTDGFRIATNVGAMNAYDALNSINQQLSSDQLQLATGKRINSAGDNARDTLSVQSYRLVPLG